VLPNSYGATATYTVNNVRPGQVYYIAATAADLSNNVPGSNGAYGLLVNFGSQPQAPIAPPNTVVLSQPDQGVGSQGFAMDSTGPGYPGSGESPIANWRRNWLTSSRGGRGSGWADPFSQSRSLHGTPTSSDSDRIRVGSLLAWGDAFTVAPNASDSTQEKAASGRMEFVPRGQTSFLPMIIAPSFSDFQAAHFGAFDPTATGSTDGTLYAIDLVLGNWSGKRRNLVHS
jgi:hypothetical protein